MTIPNTLIFKSNLQLKFEEPGHEQTSCNLDSVWPFRHHLVTKYHCLQPITFQACRCPQPFAGHFFGNKSVLLVSTTNVSNLMYRWSAINTILLEPFFWSDFGLPLIGSLELRLSWTSDTLVGITYKFNTQWHYYTLELYLHSPLPLVPHSWSSSSVSTCKPTSILRSLSVSLLQLECITTLFFVAPEY